MQRRHRNAECWTRLRQDSGFLRTRSQTFVKYLTWIRRHFIFGSGRTLSGLYKWHRLITKIYEFRLYRWLPEFTRVRFSNLKKIRTRIWIHKSWIWIYKSWNRSGIGVWKCDSSNLRALGPWSTSAPLSCGFSRSDLPRQSFLEHSGHMARSELCVLEEFCVVFCVLELSLYTFGSDATALIVSAGK